MDTNLINECVKLSLAGEITFPEVVMKLAGIGVERYIADLVGCKMHTFGQKGETYTAAMAFEAPIVAEQFDAETIQVAIRDIQQKRIDFQTFLRRIMTAGCCHYEVFINGRKAIYFGRDGAHHIEPFPTPT